MEFISEYWEVVFDFFGSIEEIFKKNIIKEEYKNKYDSNKIYIKDFNNDEYEKDCLDSFFVLTGNLPLFSNILIFKEDTVEEEYLPFLYKVLKINLNCLFVLILKQCKNNNIDNILKKINEILTGNKTSLFIILYSKQNISKIKKYLKKYEPFELIEKNEINNENLDIKNIFKTNNISLVLSDISGTGKTRYINNLKRENDNFIYFPLGGYLNKKS